MAGLHPLPVHRRFCPILIVDPLTDNNKTSCLIDCVMPLTTHFLVFEICLIMRGYSLKLMSPFELLLNYFRHNHSRIIVSPYVWHIKAYTEL